MVADVTAEPTMIATTQHGALYILAITAAATVATELIMWLWAYRSPSFRSVKVQHTLLLMPSGRACAVKCGTL
jgi:hypothetical protein